MRDALEVVEDDHLVAHDEGGGLAAREEQKVREQEGHVVVRFR